MKKLIFLILLLVGLATADSTVVDVLHFFKVENGAVSPGRVVYDGSGLNAEMLSLKLKGFDSDSIHVKFTKYVFWVQKDCTVIYNREYDNGLWNADTLGNVWMDDPTWRMLYDSIDTVSLPTE